MNSRVAQLRVVPNPEATEPVQDRVETPTQTGRYARVTPELETAAEAMNDRPGTAARVLIERATGPAFGEIRNLLNPICLNLGLIRSAVGELAPPVDPPRVFRKLDGSLAQLEECLARLQSTVLALEGAFVDDQSTMLGAALDGASQLAHHMTKLIGGLQWGEIPPMRLAISRGAATVALSATLSCLANAMLARRDSRGLVGSIERAPEGVLVCIGPADRVGGDWLAQCAQDLVPLVGAEGPITIHAMRSAVGLLLPVPVSKSTPTVIR